MVLFNIVRGSWWTTKYHQENNQCKGSQCQSVKSDLYFNYFRWSTDVTASTCGIAGVNVPPLQSPCVRHNSSIKSRMALENRWDLMIALWPGLIEWFLLYHIWQHYLLHSLPLVFAAALFLSLLPSPLPLQLLTALSPYSLSKPFHIFCLRILWELLCLIMSPTVIAFKPLQFSPHRHGATIIVKGISKIDFVCVQEGFKVFSHI